MLRGTFVENIPLIKVFVAWGRAVQAPFFILDTGFTGDLQVTPQIANELGLATIGVTSVRLANNQVVNVPVTLAVVDMEGVRNYVHVLIAKSMPLLGISLLSKFSYRAIVDCKYKTIVLQKVT